MKNNNSFKSGFVSIIGRPNVGKSTFLNKVIGMKIAAVSSKPNTTRNRIIGIKNSPGSQIVFLDTPGITHGKGVIGRSMVNVAMSSMFEADVILLMVDVKDALTVSEIDMIVKSQKPLILLINKIDSFKKSRILKVIAQAQKYEDKIIEIVPISALNNEGLDIVFRSIETYLKAGPQYYAEDTVTDQTEKFIVSEIIREKIFELIYKEIPYRTAVVIERFEEIPERNLINIHAVVYVEKQNQKGIIIGEGGKTLKEVGTLARRDIEELVGAKVYLEIWVKVKDKWTSREHLIKEFGYCN
jgi:GTPase